MTQKLIATLLLAIALGGCRNKPEDQGKSNVDSLGGNPPRQAALVGSWVEPNPIDSSEVQGFELQPGGTAQSIHMATLLYKNWWLTNHKLVLVAESVGNRTSSMDTTIYEILKLSGDSLILGHQDLILGYRKK